MTTAKELLQDLDVAELERQIEHHSSERDALLVLLRAARRRKPTTAADRASAHPAPAEAVAP